jgi:hypothetical protein
VRFEAIPFFGRRSPFSDETAKRAVSRSLLSTVRTLRSRPSGAMPGRTSPTGPAAANAAPGKRFELPALEFKFSPLTDGTNIPPPPPSPVREKKPEVPAKGEAGEANGAAKANGGANIAAQPASLKAVTAGTKRAAEDMPNSPTSSTGRPSSIRRLFSRNLLHRDYANAEQGAPPSTSASQAATEAASAAGALRPGSRSTDSFLLDDKKAKRSSSWFRRLSTRDAATAGSKRASQIYPPKEETKKTMGPPPPMIPELTDLKSKVDVTDEGSLGSDLFKNIRILE